MPLRMSLIITLILFTGSAAMAGVTLTDMGSQVKLDNGIVSATWTKVTAEMTSLKHDGDELLGNGGKGYIQQNFDDGYSNPSGARYALETNDPGFKDISFTWFVSGMEMELHYAMGENDSGGYDLSPWTIKFDMDEIVGDQAVLTIAIAAVRQGRLRVLVNNVEVLGDYALVNDSAGPRSGIQDFYMERIVKFDSSILSTASTNTIVLEQRRAGLFPSIMYDCIRLEIGFKAD